MEEQLHKYMKVRPGFLVVIKTRVRGGVTTQREDLDHQVEGAADITEWKIRRRIEDLAEYDMACAARDRARTIIKGGTFTTPFGEICPADMVDDFFELHVQDEDGPWPKKHPKMRRVKDGWEIEVFDGRFSVVPRLVAENGDPLVVEEDAVLTFDVEGELWDEHPFFTARLEDISLSKRLVQAEAVVAEHNASAVYTHVRVSTLRGEIAKSEKEAIEAITAEIKDLLVDMDGAIAIGDVKTIRDLANRARTMGKLLDQQEAAEGVLGRAIKAARTIARSVAKRVNKGGENLAEVLQAANLKPIAMARFTFGNEDIEQPKDDDLEGQKVLPAIATHRFEGLEVDDPEVEQAVSGSLQQVREIVRAMEDYNRGVSADYKQRQDRVADEETDWEAHRDQPHDDGYYAGLEVDEED